MMTYFPEAVENMRLFRDRNEFYDDSKGKIPRNVMYGVIIYISSKEFIPEA